jgi:transposase
MWHGRNMVDLPRKNGEFSLEVNSMTKQKGFTQEFEDEAVRLAPTSGRTRRELAENLGVGRSMLTRWIARNCDREIDAPEKARSKYMTAERKRLRRENEILR